MRTSTMVAILAALAAIYVSAEVIRSEGDSTKTTTPPANEETGQQTLPQTMPGEDLPSGVKLRWTDDDPEWQAAVKTVDRYGREKFEHMARHERSHSEPSGFVEFPWRLTAKVQLDAILRSCAEDQHACLDDRPVAVAPPKCGNAGSIESSDPMCDTFDEVPHSGDRHYRWWLQTKRKILDPGQVANLHGTIDYMSPPKYHRGVPPEQAVELPPPHEIKTGFTIGPLSVVRRCDPGVLEGLCLVLQIREPVASGEQLDQYDQDHCSVLHEYSRGFCGERGNYTIVVLP